MSVEIRLTRGDFFLLNLILLRKLGINWSLLAIYFAMAVATFLVLADIRTFADIGEYLLVSCALAVAAYVAASVYCLIVPPILASEYSGLGKHLYLLEADGLREITRYNDDLLKWEGMGEIIRTKRYLFVRKLPMQFHVIPVRHFASQEDYVGFCDALEESKQKTRMD